MSTELTKKKTGPKTLKEIINSASMQTQFEAALPSHLSAERFARIAITALTRNPKLLDCTQTSLMKCLLDLSAMGLEPDGRKAHLIPFKNECTVVVDYKGIVELVRRDASVVDVQCYTIREKDNVEWVNGKLNHSYNPINDRGEVKATYTRITWKSGEVSVGEPFTRKEAEAIRKRSKSANNGPWVTDFVEMWKKSNVKRDSKMWPLSSEIMDHVSKSVESEFPSMRNVTPDVSPSETNPFEDKPVTSEEVDGFVKAEAEDIKWEGDKPE